MPGAADSHESHRMIDQLQLSLPDPTDWNMSLLYILCPTDQKVLVVHSTAQHSTAQEYCTV